MPGLVVGQGDVVVSCVVREVSQSLREFLPIRIRIRIRIRRVCLLWPLFLFVYFI